MSAGEVHSISQYRHLSVFTAAVDRDTDPSNLTFTVSSPKNGHVALVSAPNAPVRHFSQAEIDSQQVVFMHTGTECANVNSNS
jgi:hypothetical protein